jgi:hypothetical protein
MANSHVRSARTPDPQALRDQLVEALLELSAMAEGAGEFELAERLKVCIVDVSLTPTSAQHGREPVWIDTPPRPKR